MTVIKKKNLQVMTFCAWMGPAFVLLFLIGAVPLGYFIPPHSGADTAVQTAATYVQNLTGIRLGCVVMIISSALFAPWGLAVAEVTRKTLPQIPILFYIQVVSVAISATDILFIPVFWGIAAYRPGEAGIEITQAWNDAGWVAILFTWPPFTVWAIAIAASILLDTSPKRAFPRWVAYFNLWAGLLFAPAGMMLFFKTGPFSQSGVIAFWIPVVVFFFWICGLTHFVLRSLNAEEDGLIRTASAGTLADSRQ